MTSPAISVLLAVYNDADCLTPCITSMLNQTFRDFELIIVDDGSTDATRDRLREFDDPRIRIVEHDHNQGLTRALATGMQHCRGDLVARIDADETADPSRLERQEAVFAVDERVGLCGSAALLVDAEGRTIRRVRLPLHDETIRWRSLFLNPFFGTAMMFRRSVYQRLETGYDPAYRTAQDYDLFSRMLPFCRAVNLSDILVHSKVRDGITVRRRDEQLANHMRIVQRNLHALMPDVPVDPDQARMMFELLTAPAGRSVKHRNTGPCIRLYHRILETYLGVDAGPAPRVHRVATADLAHMIMRPGPHVRDASLWRMLFRLDPAWPVRWLLRETGFDN